MSDQRKLMAYAGLAFALGSGATFTSPLGSYNPPEPKRKPKDRSKQKAARKAKNRNRKP